MAIHVSCSTTLYLSMLIYQQTNRLQRTVAWTVRLVLIIASYVFNININDKNEELKTKEKSRKTKTIHISSRLKLFVQVQTNSCIFTHRQKRERLGERCTRTQRRAHSGARASIGCVCVCVCIMHWYMQLCPSSRSTRSRESPTADGWRHSAGCYQCLRTSVAICNRLSAAADQETTVGKYVYVSERTSRKSLFAIRAFQALR